jgi:hypothetical protein
MRSAAVSSLRGPYLLLRCHIFRHRPHEGTPTPLIPPHRVDYLDPRRGRGLPCECPRARQDPMPAYGGTRCKSSMEISLHPALLVEMVYSADGRSVWEVHLAWSQFIR